MLPVGLKALGLREQTPTLLHESVAAVYSIILIFLFYFIEIEHTVWILLFQALSSVKVDT